MQRYAFGVATPHVPDATARLNDSGYYPFWGADFTDGLHVAYVRPTSSGDSELLEAVCTGI